MKTKMILPAALAALTAGTGLFALVNQSDAQDRRQADPSAPRGFRFEFRNDGSAPRLFENGREVQRGGAADDADSNDPLSDMMRRLLELQGQTQNPGQTPPRRGNGNGGQRGQTNPFGDLLKELGGDAQDGEKDGGNAPRGRENLNPQELMRELMRRMSQGRPGQLGFGPGNAEKDLPRTSKHHLSALAEWRPLVASARQSTVRVLQDDRQIALATIVSADGYALTKASEVSKGEVECEFPDGRIVSAKVVDELGSYDLALIKLDADGLIPAKFLDAPAPVGTLIAAVSTSEDPTGLGVISVAARSLDESSKGFLGVQMDVVEIPPKGVRIDIVIDGGAAKRAGIEPGDIILSINGEEIANPRQLKKIISDLKPEDKVNVTIERDKKSKSLELSLGHRSEDMLQRQLDQTALMGSSLNENATGYPNAVQSDLALQAKDAGGPVVNVDGAVIGLNIARSERVSTYLIPGKVINELLTDVEAGKFNLSKDADTLHAELREYNANYEKAQAAAKEAETKRKAAMEALEKLGKK